MDPPRRASFCSCAFLFVLICNVTFAEIVNYNEKNRTVLLKLELDKMPDRMMMDSFVSSVLQWPGGDCLNNEVARCTDLKDSFEATVRSTRICIGLSTSSYYFCDITASIGQQTVEVVHHHIANGCYCFRLSSYRDDNIRMAWHLVDRPVFLLAENKTLIEYDIFKWNVTLDLSATSRNDLKLTIDQIGGTDDYDFQSYHVDLYQIENSDSPCTDESTSKEHLDVFETAGQTVTVNFINHTIGSYCVIITPNDERCEHGSETCARHSNTVTLTDLWIESESVLITSTAAFNNSFLMACSLIAFVAILLLSIAVFYYLKRKRNLKGRPLDDDVSPRLLPFRPAPPLLLFHSHRMGDQNERNQIRHTLRHRLPNCQIYDDDNNEDAISEGAEWFWNRLTSKQDIRVVVIFCRQMLHCQHHLLGLNHLNQDQPIDLVCLQRLQQLLHYSTSNERDVYKRIFVVRLDDGLDWPGTCLLTPYATYNWPSDRSSLIEALSQGLGDGGGILKQSPQDTRI